MRVRPLSAEAAMRSDVEPWCGAWLALSCWSNPIVLCWWGLFSAPLPDDVFFDGSGGNCYLARGHTIVVAFIFFLWWWHSGDLMYSPPFVNCWGLLSALDRIICCTMLQHSGCVVLCLCRVSTHQFVATCVVAPVSVTVSPLVIARQYCRIRGGVGGGVNSFSYVSTQITTRQLYKS